MADDNDPAALALCGEIKKGMDEVGAAFAVYKTKNDARLAEIEKKGSADVVTREELKKLDGALDTLQKNIDAEIVKLKRPAFDTKGREQSPEALEHKLAFGDWFRYGARGNLHALEKKAFGFNAVETKALSSGTDPDGGYLVPREMETAMDRILGTVSAMRSLATVRAISGSGYRKPVNVGGTASGWVGETGGRAETTAPSISVLDFPAMELYAHPYATQTLLDDSAVNIEQWLADEVAIEFAEEEGAAFVSGNGVNKPTGVLGATTVANASYVWGKIGFVVTGAASDFATTNPIDALVTLQDALKTGYSVNGTWLMTRATQSAIRKFKDGTGNYIWQPAMQAAVAPTIFGKPVVVDDNMNEIGSNLFPVAYGDFRRGYIIVDRIGIRVLRDPYSAKPYVTFYTTKRVGGGIQNFEAIKLLKCSV